MLGPNAISSGFAPSKSAIAACACAQVSAVSTEVANGPPACADPSRIRCTIPAIALSQAAVPPGASKKTAPRANAGKRVRTASIGKSGIKLIFLGGQEKRASILACRA